MTGHVLAANGHADRIALAPQTEGMVQSPRGYGASEQPFVTGSGGYTSLNGGIGGTVTWRDDSRHGAVSSIDVSADLATPDPSSGKQALDKVTYATSGTDAWWQQWPLENR